MSLQDVLLEELRDLYSAENQLVKALPKVAKAVDNAELKDAVKNHLEQTKSHVDRLKGIFQNLGKKPSGEHCMGMEGLIKEGTEAIESEEEGAVKDVELIGAALRVEHYEVAGYTTAISIAKALGHKDVAATLTETLNEEKDTAKLLLGHANPLLKEAATADEEDEEEEDPEIDEEEEEADADEVDGEDGEDEDLEDEDLDDEEVEETEEEAGKAKPVEKAAKAPTKRKAS